MLNKAIITENQKKQKEFTESQEIQQVKLSEIILTEPIHINTKVDLSKKIEMFRKKNYNHLNNPLIVRKLEENKYSLIIGYSGYIIANALNFEYVPVVIAEDEISGRLDFVKSIGINNPICKDMNIKDIIVPKSFLERKVSKAKVQKALDYYNKHKQLDKPVVIQGKRLLIDGYSRFVVAKILKLDTVPVVFQ